MSSRSGIIYIDGASKGNPGPSGCGVVVQTDGETIFEGAFALGKTTNNVAEYQGLLHGLQKASELSITDLEVRSDSQLLVFQMTGSYKVKAAHLKPLWQKAQDSAKMFSSIRYTHVPREQNNIADGLANEAIK